MPKAKSATPTAASLYFNQKIEEARKAGSIITDVIKMTPELAQILLENNRDNRRIKEAKLGAYIADMNEGRWTMNGEAIIIAQDGTLNDGQHRARAVVASGQSIETVIVFGTSRESRHTLDTGAARTPGDILKLAGYPSTNTNILAATTKLVMMYENSASTPNQRILTSGNRISTAAIQERLNKDDQELLLEATAFASKHSHDLYGKLLPSQIGFCYWLLTSANPIEGPIFMERLATQDGTSSADAEWLLARNLTQKKAKGDKPTNIIEAVVRAWNLKRQGKVPHRIPASTGVIPVVRS